MLNLISEKKNLSLLLALLQGLHWHSHLNACILYYKSLQILLQKKDLLPNYVTSPANETLLNIYNICEATV